MKRLVSLLTFVSLLLIPTLNVQSTEGTAPKDIWLYDAFGYARAVELQRQLKVPLVVYFYADWCPYCRTLDSQYLPSRPVTQYLSRVVKVRINPEHGPAERELAARFGVTGYPAFFVLGESTRKQINPFRRNGVNLTPDQFAKACQRGGGQTTRVTSASSIIKPTVPRNSVGAIGENTSRKRGGVQITEVPKP